MKHEVKKLKTRTAKHKKLTAKHGQLQLPRPDEQLNVMTIVKINLKLA